MFSRYVERLLMPRTVHIVQQKVKRNVARGAFAVCCTAVHNAHMQMANIRKLRNLSQRALADLVGVDASTIQRAEAMADSAMLKTYKMAAQALGVTLSDLFSEQRTASEQGLLEVFRRIPESRHRELVRLLEIAATPQTTEGQ
jgi:transcriptional regulator with XRE-family HTH domain